MPAEAMAHCYKVKCFSKLNKVLFFLFKKSASAEVQPVEKTKVFLQDADGCQNVTELTSYTSKYYIYNLFWLLF